MKAVFESTPSSQLTLVDILSGRARHEPKLEAYTFLLDGETKQAQMTYADLDREARRVAAHLQAHLVPGERALLLYPPGLSYVAAIFGCWLAGVVAVPAYPPRLNQSLLRIQTIFQDARASAALTTSTLLSALRCRSATDPLMQNLQWIATDTMDPQGVASYRESQIDPCALALLQYTSGSTSSPKGVMLTHENLMQNAALIQEGMSLTSLDRGLFWLPPYHDMGLMGGILQALYTGYPTVLMAPAAFLQRPVRWLHALSSFHATVSGAPNFAYDLCVKSATEETIKALDLSSWTLAFTGAEPVRAQTLERFSQTFADSGFRPEAFYPCYGLAETTLFVSGGHRHEKPRIRAFDIQALEAGHVVEVTGEHSSDRPLVSCGSVRKPQEIVIVDPERHTRLPSGTIGEIWVRGPHVASGYWGKVEESEETFHAFLRRELPTADRGRRDSARLLSVSLRSDEGPFLRTGDLGFCLDNELFVTGRLKDLIIIRGRNLYPQDIEQVVEKSHPLLRPSCCAVFAVEGKISEQLVVVQEVGRHADDVGAQEAIQAICQAVLSEFDVEVAAIELLRAGTIFKTTSGKIQRRACRSRFLAGELNTVHSFRRTPPPRSTDMDGIDPSMGVGGKTMTLGEEIDAPEMQEIVDWLVMDIAQRAHIDTCAVDIYAPFVQFGLNSLEAVGLSGELEQWLGRSLSPTLIYDYPSINALARYLVDGELAVEHDSPLRKAHGTTRTDAIAIIGLGCRFPGADNPEAFWKILYDGIDGISLVPATRWDTETFYAPEQATQGKMNTRWGGFLPHIEQFDFSFFNIAPREAAQMDPQQRLLLEVAWETLESAGLAPDLLADSQTGVFIGISSHDYSRLSSKTPEQMDAYAGTGNAQSIAANRLSYFFDFHGPSVAVDTACSSSLFAVHQACQSLRNGECDLALAGGVNVILEPLLTVTFSQARMMSSDGRCKTFDEAADGYVRGEGCGLVLLKPLAAALRDGDTVLAIVRGSAVNQDGRSNGLTAPHGPSQGAVIQRALQNANVTASQISYVETHGSSTPLGDPIEVDALKAVLMRHRSPDQSCLLGAVKTNIGHLEAAAGIAGLIKTVLCLQKGVIAPNLHFKRLNPRISLEGTTFEIPTEPRPWPSSPDSPRFAGVSAFGFGGTNVHVILEGAPSATTSRRDSASGLSERPLHLLTLSGRTAQALPLLAQRYLDFLAAHSTDRHKALSLRDLCATANTGRTHFVHRLAVYAENREEMRERLAAFVAGQPPKEMQVGRGETRKGQAPALAFLFTGQGSQYTHMAYQLYKTQPTFRQALDECDRLLQNLQSQDHSLTRLDQCEAQDRHKAQDRRKARSLRSVLYPADGATSPLNETAYTQLALFALEYALAQMWLSWGIKPDVVMGHSIGEYVAACIAGVFSLSDGLKLVTARSRLMQSLPEQGTMAVIFAEPERVQSFVAPYSDRQVSLAALNGPKNTVISGKEETIQLIVQHLEAEGVRAHPLSVSHAFHSPLMEPMLDAFEQVASSVAFAPLRLPLVCNLTGQLINAGETLDAHYWRRQTREAVQFAAGIQTLSAHGYQLFLELGPTPALSNMGERCLPVNSAIWLPSLHQDHNDWHVLMQSIACLYSKGYDLNWSGFESDWRHHKIVLPTYPFEREYCWFKSKETDEPVGTGLAPVHGTGPSPVPTVRSNEINQWLYQLCWEAVDLPKPMTSTPPGHWLVFLDQKGIGQHFCSQLREQGHTCTLIEAGQNFQILDQHHYQINPANPQEIKQAVGTALATVRTLPLRGVVHYWSLDTTPVEALNLMTLEADQILGVQSALSLIQALIEQSVQTRLWLITQGAQPVEVTDTDLAISQAPIWGLGKTCAMEHPELWGGLVDLDPHAIVNDAASKLMRMLQDDWREDQIALRGANTYVARMVRMRAALTLQEPRALRLTTDVAYLITGGLWGMGLECARWLAMQGARYLILLGRSKLPPRETWEQVQPESRQGLQIAGIRAIERLGALVYYASVDVADSAQLTEFLHLWNCRDLCNRKDLCNCRDNALCLSECLPEERPPIRGIIHAASVWQDAQGQSLVRPIVNLNTEDLTTVLRPKMLGGWLLSNLLKETPLDFFVSFSSAATLFGSVAQGNYAAASSFLDVLAHHQRAHGQPAISIDWGAISEIGYGATPEGLRVHEYWESHGIGRLSPRQVLATLELLMQTDLVRVGVLRLDWQLLREFYPQMVNLPLVSQLVSSKKETRDAAHKGTHNEPDIHNGRSVLQILQDADEEEHSAILTSYLKAQIASVLRVPAQGLKIEEPLTSLGFDSLMAIELRNRVDFDLQIRLPIVTLLREPSITQLVKQVLALNPSGIGTVRAGLVPIAPSPDEKARTGDSPVEARTETVGVDRVGPCPESCADLVPAEPLSHNQKALWFLSRLEPESAAYNLLYVARIQQHLDVPALQRALQRLSARYPILTSTYTLQNSEPVQQTRVNQPIPLEVIDANSRNLNDLKLLLLEESNQPIDLTTGPVLRLQLYQRADDDHLLGFILHHIVADFWALDLLVDELSLLYTVEKTDMAEPQARWPRSDFQHADYVRWQNSMLQSEEGEQHWRYWQTVLAGDLPVLNLPTDRPRPPIQTYRGASQGFSFSTDLAKRLRSIASGEQVTLFTLMLTAYQVLLHRYSNQDDILVGTPALGRTRSAFERVIGSLTNPIVVRARLGQNPTFKELLQQTKRSLLTALEHQDFPFPLLVERLQLQRDPSTSPIYQTLFIWDRPRTRHGEERAGHSQALSLVPFAYGQQGAPFDLTLTVFEMDDRLSADFRYNVDLFDAASCTGGAGAIDRMAENFLTLLDGITTNLDQHIREIPLLPDKVRQTLLTEWNATHCDYPQEMTVHQLFEQQVEQTPDSVALAFGEDQALTYAELNQQANRLAHHLRGLGIGPDDLIGIYMERSIQMGVALLAVLKAGGAYVPLDPAYPQERLAFIITDSQVTIVLTHHLPGGHHLPTVDWTGKVINLDTDWNVTNSPIGEDRVGLCPVPGTDSMPHFNPVPCDTGIGNTGKKRQENPLTPVTSANLAYVIYTSGSTGKPKGTMVTHRNVMNFFTAMDQRIGDHVPGIWLAVTSISFDISILELFWTLTRGFRVVVQSDQQDRLLPQSNPQGKVISTGNPRSHRTKELEFSLFYFANDAAGLVPAATTSPAATLSKNKYRLLLEGAKFADEHNFAAVWTPERHFHAFGGLYPNPSVTGAAIATITQKIQIRAGSVVLPLHDPVRVAEEWAVVDNLSAGRVGISVATGWHANDFVLAPEQYTDRKKILMEKIETVRKLWRGETITLPGPQGNTVQVKIFPQPIQPELPIWMTSSGNPETFRQAGEMGVNLLTHLLGQNIESLAEKIAIYRDAWQVHGHTGSGHVTLMLHTFIGTESTAVREKVRQPFTNYLRSSVELFQTLAESLGYDTKNLSEDDLNVILAHGFERYYETSGLMGTVSTCLPMVERLKKIGVDEVACLIDFGVDEDAVLASLHELAKLKERSHWAGLSQAPFPTRDLPLSAPLTSKTTTVEMLPVSIKKLGITHLQCTPSLASVFLLEKDGGSALGSLQKLLLGGEALPISLVKQLSEIVVGEIHNMYGPTETTIWSTTQRIEKNANAVSIGRPIANTQVYILDKHLQLLPVGVPGELFIGGQGVVRGYLNQPALTAEKFLPDPYGKGEAGALIYRTGDVARYLPDGTIEYLGRIDSQVKLRGFRIELGEIETVLRAHPGVQEAVVILHEESEGRKYLMAYVVPVVTRLLGHTGQSPSVLELQEHLREQLPDYMVPTSVVFLDALPLSPNGKVDRKALAQGTGSMQGTGQGLVGAGSAQGTTPTAPALSAPTVSGSHKPTFVAPHEPVEHILAAIWQQILGRKLVGIHDNFFALGGDSILSMQMIARARQAGLELTLKQFFQNQTIAQLARVAGSLGQAHLLGSGESGSAQDTGQGLVGAGLAPALSAPMVPNQWQLAEVTGPVLLTPIQRWFLEQDLSQPQHFNQAVLLEIPSSWNLQHIQQVVDTWLVEHDALRLRYERTTVGWLQRLVSVAEAGSVAVERIDLTEEEASDTTLANGQEPSGRDMPLPLRVPISTKVERVANRVQASLDLERGPLLRLVLFDLGNGRASRLLVTIHHLAVDGISWRVLISDLLVAMTQLRKGEPITLPAKTTSFQRWALHVQELARSAFMQRERAYWLRVVQTPVAPLPVELVESGQAQGIGQAQGTVPTEGCNTGAYARTVSVALTREETQLLLQEAPRPYRSHIQELLLVPLLQTLARWMGTQTIRLDLEGHGREELGGLDVSRTVGWFTSLYPVLFTLPQDDESQPSDRRKAQPQWIKTIKEQLRAVPHKGIGYGLLRYLCEDRELREQLASATPSQVIFNYLGQFDQMVANSTETSETIQATLESIGAVNGPENQRSYLLEVDGLVIGGQLHLRWTYSEQFHRQATIEALAQEFLQALRDLLDHCLSPEAGGLTPSDFPLAGLDQASLDRLLASRSHRASPDGRTGASGQGQAAAPTSPYGPDGVEDLYPLTPLQQGLLFHTLSAPQSGIYIEQVSCTLRGEIEMGALERAWQWVITRYTILRTAFVWQELSEPLQIVFPQAKLPTHILDWRSRSREQQEADLEAFLYIDRTEGFDLDQAPLMRVTLVRLSETHTQMILTHHHLLLDGWSQSRLLQEVLACYKAEMQGLSLAYEEPRPYRDYVSWLADQDNREARTYWQQVLVGIVAPTPLLVDRNEGKGASPTFTALSQEYQSERIYAEEALQVDAVTMANWQEYARQEHVTLNTLVQAAWALVLSRYSGQADVVFGNVVAGRPPELAGVERMIGLFINTVPVRVQVHDEEEVGVWLRQLQRQQSEQRSYEYSSLVQVQGWSEVPREHALFESLFIFENYPVQAAFAGQKDQLQVDAVQVIEQTNYPLTISVHPGTEVSLKVNYDRQRFEPATIERLLGHLKRVLEQFVADPQQRLGAVSLLTEKEREQLLVQWNATEIPIGSDLCVHQLFEQQGEQTPDSVALVFEDELLTYAELNRRANQLAHHLQGLGVGPEVLVGIALVRSIGMVVGLLAALKAGSAYVPLDPIYPQERLAYMIQEAQVAVLLTQSHLQERLRAEGITIVAVDIEIVGQEDNPVSAIQPDHLAYVIYTSGSTGKPKGVMNTHRGLCNRLFWMQQAYQLTYEDRILQKTPFGFDVSVWEFFWPLLTGASLIIARPGGHQDPTYLRTLIARQQVTTLHFVPSMLQAFLWSESTDYKAILESCTSLRQVICSGEALSVELQAHFFAHFAEQVQLHNLYGPTEAAIDVTFWKCQRDRRDSARLLSDGGRVPIGRPIANTQIYLLDADLQPVPIGIPGELYIGGVGLARGYLKRPDLTAEKFIANPFPCACLGERLYRTGDLARYRTDGAIEFLGRIDQQVKLRGFRIEPGEIEATLRGHARVQDAVVVLCEEDEERRYLAAYVAKASTPLEPLEEQSTQEELQNYLRERLPDYMVPAVIVSLQTLPLTPNGKVNRKALPIPERAMQSEEGYVAPQSELERHLTEIWQQVLGGRTQVGIYDNFFELGGHSLLLIQVCSKLQTYLGYEIPVVNLFKYPTIHALSLHLSERQEQRPLLQPITERVQKRKEALRKYKSKKGKKSDECRRTAY